MLSSLFPELCLGCRRLLRSSSSAPLCTHCRTSHAPFPPTSRRRGWIEALYPYESPLARALADLKFSGELALAGSLGALLARAPLLRQTPPEVPWDLLIPVPLHPRQLLWRGYNQSLLLAQWTLFHAQRHGLRPLPALRPALLKRIKATESQRELDAHQRLENVQRAFVAPNKSDLRNANVLLLDDVTTTGATLAACREALFDGGAKHIAALVLLRTEAT